MAPAPSGFSPEHRQMLDQLDAQVLQLDRQVLRRLMSLGYQPQSVFDVGASNGGWSYYMKQVLQQTNFYLFEPLVDYCPTYQTLMTEMLAVYPDFQLYPYALGDHNGDVLVKIFADPAASTTLSLGEGAPVTRQVSVPMLTLDDARQKFGLPYPDILKIDIQGSELAVLQGAQQTLEQVGILFLECWLYRGYGPQTPLLMEIVQWLLPFNFRLWDITEPYRDPDGTLTTLDCVFVNTRLELTPNWYY